MRSKAAQPPPRYLAPLLLGLVVTVIGLAVANAFTAPKAPAVQPLAASLSGDPAATDGLRGREQPDPSP